MAPGSVSVSGVQASSGRARKAASSSSPGRRARACRASAVQREAAPGPAHGERVDAVDLLDRREARGADGAHDRALAGRVAQHLEQRARVAADGLLDAARREQQRRDAAPVAAPTARSIRPWDSSVASRRNEVLGLRPARRAASLRLSGCGLSAISVSRRRPRSSAWIVRAGSAMAASPRRFATSPP